MTKLIVFAGCAASGKTTLARIVAKRLGIMLIDKDDATRRFTDMVLQLQGLPLQDRESQFYVDRVRGIEYETVFAIAEENLLLGNDVVISAPFIHVIRDRERWCEGGYPEPNDRYDVVLVWVAHDIDREHARMTARGALRDGNKLAHWDEYAASLAGIAPDDRYGAIIVENPPDADLDIVASRILDAIEGRTMSGPRCRGCL